MSQEGFDPGARVSKAAPLVLGEMPTCNDIRAFIEAPDEQPVALWTLQQAGAVKSLVRTGRLCGTPEFAYAERNLQVGKIGAYDWAVEQGARLQEKDWHCLPMWAMFHKPEYSNRENDVILSLVVPKRRIVPCFYGPWVDMLGIFYEIRGGSWPSVWYNPTGPFLDPYLPERTDCSIPIPPPEVDCRESWKQIFELRLALDDRFQWSRQLQALLPDLRLEEVVNEEAVPVI